MDKLVWFIIILIGIIWGVWLVNLYDKFKCVYYLFKLFKFNIIELNWICK